MSIIEERIKSKNDELNQLDLQIMATRRKQRGTSDPAYKVELQTTIDQCEEEYKRIDAELKVLNQHCLPEKTAEELQKHIVETWELNCHRIDYQLTLEKQMQPMLKRIKQRQGGAVIFLIEEGSRMHCKWLLKRVREWTETQQNSTYLARRLIIDSLEKESFLSALAAAFGLQADGTPGKFIKALSEDIYKSASRDDMVIALEVTIRMVSAGTLIGFLEWFLGSIWNAMLENHPTATRNRPYVRLVWFVVTDLKLKHLPKHIGVAASASASDCGKCMRVRVAPWQKEDVVQWMVSFSELQRVECTAEKLRDYGVDAHENGYGGIPLPTWAYLHELMQDELNSRIEEMKHGKLAAV